MLPLYFSLAIALEFDSCRSARQDQLVDPSWMHCKWNGHHDSEYHGIRLGVESARGDKQKLEAIVHEAWLKCTSSGAKSTDLFRWADSVIERSHNDFDYWYKAWNVHEFRKPYDLFTKLSVPDSYEFTRIRFIFTTYFEFPHRMMGPVGEKLLDANPDDIDVQIALIKIYQPQAFEEDAVKGDALVARLERDSPHELRVLGATGYYYYKSWLKRKSRTLATEATKRMLEVRAKSTSSRQRDNIDLLVREMNPSRS